MAQQVWPLAVSRAVKELRFCHLAAADGVRGSSLSSVGSEKRVNMNMNSGRRQGCMLSNED
jgi:hypothetical protein